MRDFKYIQSFLQAAGNNACYALQIIGLSNRINLEAGVVRGGNCISDLTLGIEKGYIEWHDEDYAHFNNFFVLKPAEFLSLLTGENFAIKFVGADYVCKDGEYAIDFWAKSQANANKGIGHFRTEDSDTLQKSQTVAVGKIYSRRIFYRLHGQ